MYNIVKTKELDVRNPFQNLYYDKQKRLFCFDVWNIHSPKDFKELSGHVTVFFDFEKFNVFKFGDFQGLTSYKELDHLIELKLNKKEKYFICTLINYYLMDNKINLIFYPTLSRF